jgi:SAM-dependent methyltransferase
MDTPDDELAALTTSEAMYRDGSFAAASQGHQDAEYKVRELEGLLRARASQLPDRIQRVADVGCGSGRTTLALAELLERLGHRDARVTGFDLHPSVTSNPARERVDFQRRDFLECPERFDLVVLFDVIEHVPAPVDFLRAVAKKARFVALHIPLDGSALSLARNLNRANLDMPGHLLILDLPSAINLVTLSGLRPMDYALGPGFRAPSGQATRLQKSLLPARALLYKLSPYLLQRTLGGVSLSVLARSPSRRAD